MFDIRILNFLLKIFSRSEFARILYSSRSRILDRGKWIRKPNNKNTKYINKIFELTNHLIKQSWKNSLNKEDKIKIESGFLAWRNIMDDNTNKFNKLKEKYPYCQLCWKTGVRTDVHHIVYRSEVPRHKHLHSEKNLIVLCRSCHERMHSQKDFRETLYYSRGLHKLFKYHAFNQTNGNDS
jgi:hypothetical protein